MNQPRVYIILVNYNGFDDTVDCIKSLKNSSYMNYKIIVVDNNSTITTTQEHMEYIRANSEWISSEKNLGFSGGNNLGIVRAIQEGADYVLLLNNDTVVDEECLQKLIDVANSQSESVVVTCKINYYEEKSVIWYGGGQFDSVHGVGCHERYQCQDDGVTKEIRKVSFATGCVMLIPRDILMNIGYLDESFFLYAEDTEYSLRIQKYGYGILYLDDAVVYHKVSRSVQKTSVSSQYYVIRNSIRVARRYCPNFASAKRYWRTFCIKSVMKRKLPPLIAIKAFKDGIHDISGPYKGR